MRTVRKVRRAAKRLRDTLASGSLILLYHRVTELPLDPQLLSVTPRHFAEHLQILRESGHPVRLQRLTKALEDGRTQDRTIVVTFDDGYSDNLHNAQPLLDRYDVPATVFVTSGHICNAEEFWWDELERLLLHAGTLPQTLSLSIGSASYQWQLGESSSLSSYAQQHHYGWSVVDENDPSPRHGLYRSLCQLLRPLTNVERRKVLDDVLAWVGAEPIVRSTHRPLSYDEVIRLDRGGLVAIGAHTVTHPILSRLPVSMQRAEVNESKTFLEEILGHRVASFAYPYGKPADYGAET
ncbi:MAG: polysaccharide deacetylase family protein, partial [Chloroflexi bacterium]|nr:polysaccharide deacetylase family protein [Chloroflexota bacterium]